MASAIWPSVVSHDLARSAKAVVMPAPGASSRERVAMRTRGAGWTLPGALAALLRCLRDDAHVYLSDSLPEGCGGDASVRHTGSTRIRVPGGRVRLTVTLDIIGTERIEGELTGTAQVSGYRCDAYRPFVLTYIGP